MKKSSTIFTTTLLVLGLMLAAPTTMAKPDEEKENKGNKAAIRCFFLKETMPPSLFVIVYTNFGQCVKQEKH